MKKRVLLLAVGLALAVVMLSRLHANPQARRRAPTPWPREPAWFPIPAVVVGHPRRHRIEPGQTYLDVARMYKLGFNEIQDLYPADDPWIPKPGRQITIPSQWIIPDGPHKGIIINVAEMRLYFFTEHPAGVYTFPIGIGDEDAVTPTGFFRIKDKCLHPAWTIPPSLQYKYPVKYFPPGPGNPLGDHWMGLSKGSVHTHFGIHGTDNPWSIGRLVTHGCIRLYPEDIRFLFNKVERGTRVRIMYQPVKLGISTDRVYVEVHKDVYARGGDLVNYGDTLLKSKGIAGRIDPEQFHAALRRQDGLPVDVTRPDWRAFMK